MSPLVGFGTVQQRILVFVLVAAVFGASIVVVVGIAVTCFNLGGPSVVLCVFTAHVVRIRGVGFIGEDAFAEEFEKVIPRDCGCETEENTTTCDVSNWAPTPSGRQPWNHLQYHNANANTRFADVTFAFTAPLERGAVALVVWDISILCAFLDAAAVP
jgi:hypothetical protein